uniref:Nudix hydrolase domain-containing protein n=1 Tax=Noccaea caerulescens TaxID=107243 RepID=A0A1J3HX83_NOCCA
MFVGRPPPNTPLVNRRNNHRPRHATVSSALPDLFLAAVSLLFLWSSPKPLLSLPPNRFSFPLNPRRRTTAMSRRSPPTPKPLSQRFANPQSLSDWLESRLPSDSFAAWGVKPGTKNVHNLWLELSDGETSLADSTPPVRTVNVVTVRVIGKNGKILVEAHQELSDGSIRDRFRPLSEKMKPEETPDEAVFRAIKEELGSIFNGDDEQRIKVLPGSYSRRVEERNSLSYPGLPARYALHSVDATVQGLPEEDFSTEEKEYGGDSTEDSEETRAAGKAVTVKRHHWKWVSPNSIRP